MKFMSCLALFSFAVDIDVISIVVSKDPASEKHGHARQTVVVLLLLYHRLDHAAWVDPGAGHPGHVHHRCQVSLHM